MGRTVDEYWDYREARWVRSVREQAAGQLPAPAEPSAADLPAQRDGEAEPQPAGG